MLAGDVIGRRPLLPCGVCGIGVEGGRRIVARTDTRCRGSRPPTARGIRNRSDPSSSCSSWQQRCRFCCYYFRRQSAADDAPRWRGRRIHRRLQFNSIHIIWIMLELIHLIQLTEN